MKKSVILLELIFSILLLSIIFLTSSKFIFEVYEKNKTNYTANLLKIEFESTRLFLLKLLTREHNLNNITYKNKKLYYNSSILQNNVVNFEIQKDNNLYNINLCINTNPTICQVWILR